VKRLILLSTLAAFAVTVPMSHRLKANEKVEVCHIPPGNPCNAHYIEVSVNAVPAHLEHCGTVNGEVFCDVVGNEAERACPAVLEACAAP